MLTRRLEDVALVLDSPKDQVAIAKEDIPADSKLVCGEGIIEMDSAIRKGQRFALWDIAGGELVRQYGYPFGRSRGIAKGELVTADNVESVLPGADPSNFVEPNPTPYSPEYTGKTFLGYVRRTGTVGTRNYYLIVPTSMCASETAMQIACRLDNLEEVPGSFANIDGVIAVPHTEGCGCVANEQIDRVLRVLKGFVLHSNVGGCLIVDLGCEQTNYGKVYPYLKSAVEACGKPVDWITIQDCGGTRKTLERACSIVVARLPEVNKARRMRCPIEHLVVGTECGASDSFSGITPNPIIGNAVDKVIFGRGSAILSEVPEMVGTFAMLLPRFRNMEVAQDFLGIVQWYEALARRLGLSLEDNLVPKNREGGLINNFIKSLGAVMKGGTTVIEDVVDYGEPLRGKGLTVMQGPGGDLESVTGLTASGATIICFSTGKGTTTGSAICPVIKVASTDELAGSLPEDIDFNAGRLLIEKVPMDALGEELFEMILRVASGEKTWSEKWKQRQFQIWTAGKLSV